MLGSGHDCASFCAHCAVLVGIQRHHSCSGDAVETRKLEHECPHALKVKYKDPSTNPPTPMLQLSGIRCRN